MVVVRLDNDDLVAAMRHLNRAFAGVDKKIKRQASAKLRKLMRPLAEKRKTAVLRLPSKGHSGPSMRQAIAKQIRPATRWSGSRGGVSIVQRARGMPRDFPMAGRAFNREEGWNPKNLAGETEHQQVTPAAWFDSEADVKEQRLVRQELIQALDEVAGSLADEIRRTR